MAHDVFVSYSSKDKAVADAVVASLEINNIRCWYAPRDVKPGEVWGEAITKGIEKCEILLLIFSGHSNHSDHVLAEILYAISEERTIIPFRIENLDPTGAMRLHLSSRQWLDAYEPSWESHIKKLVANISIILQVDLGEDQVQVPGGVKKYNKPIKKKKVGLIVSILTSVIILSLGGWLGFRAFFPPQTEVRQNETPTKIMQETILPLSSEASNIKPDKEEGIDIIEEDKILNLAYSIGGVSVLDPQKAITVEEKTLTENLFISLTHFNSETYEVESEAAQSWSISEDRLTYTFIIRQDIPWVTTTPEGQTNVVLDKEGNPKYVSGSDFEYAIRRLCIAGTGLPIVGCDEVSAFDDPENIPEEIIDAIGVNTFGFKLSIELIEPSASFLVRTSELDFSPLPSWAIEEYGYAWADPDTIQTNGRFVIGEVKPGESINLIRNPILPKDLSGEGNIDQINIMLNIPSDDQYSLWKDSLIDFSIIPDEFVAEHKSNYPDGILTGERVSLLILFLNMNKAPFDNVYVRRAFAASLDKVDFVQKYFTEIAIPKNDLFLSGGFSGPGYEVDSLEFDTDFAKNELAEGGYPNCVGLSPVSFFNATSAIQIPEEFIQSWEEALGCPENTIQIDPGVWNDQETDILFWTFGGDIPELLIDFHEGMLSCYWSGGFRFPQGCDEFENLLIEAGQANTINEKLSMLQQFEEAIFGLGGDFRMIPLCQHQTWYAVHQGLEINSPVHLYSEYYNWILDQEKMP